MRGYKTTDLGQVVIDPKVVVSYASDVANGTPGIVGMAFIDAKDGIAKLLKREAAFKGIKVTIEDNKVSIEEELKALEELGAASPMSMLADWYEDTQYRYKEFK